ncbi:HSP20-like chaperone [Sesbania bispinosa]|nr:HSP20-like chaperone [Sesbania bispinosa]
MSRRRESKINVGVRGIFTVVQKAEIGWWKRLLKGEGKPPHYVKVDWDKWVDEDEDEGTLGYLSSISSFHVLQTL